jgi:hypothetical protein
MTPATLLGGMLLASADELGSVDALAREIGVSRQTLTGAINGRDIRPRALLAIVAYLGLTAQDAAEALEPDTGQAWQPRHAAGGKARQGSLCTSCGERLSRDAALARWHGVRQAEATGQMTIQEAGT